MARRPRKTRKLKQSIYIVAEGTNTERIYFEAIIEQIEENAEKYSFQVKFVETDKTDAIGLINRANELKPECDEIWAVFDKNGYTRHQQAFEKAEQYHIQIAFSSIAFENWILLHFERNKTSFPKAQQVIDYVHQQNYLVGYDKKSNTNIYPKLKSRTELAIENAVWLRHEMTKVFEQENGRIYQLNPYTTVDYLVAKILEIDDKVIWGNVGETITFDSISVTVTHKIFTDRLDIKLWIENHRKTGYLINNYGLKCYLATDLVCSFPFSFKKAILIEPSSQKEIALNLSLLKESYLRLDFIHERTKMIIQI
jgi:hypothetical protein